MPESGEVLSPWVRVTLTKTGGGGGGSITVGNDSFPTNNTACIKDFEYGKADSLNCRIVIQDEQGGSFVQFAEALLKDYKCAKPPFDLSIEFGWTKSLCGFNGGVKNSGKAYMMVQSIETNFSKGKFQYEITGTDVMTIGQEGNSDKSIGGDGDEGEHLVNALRQLLTEDPAPRVEIIKFCKIGENGQCTDSEFDANNDDEKKLGPKRKWQARGMDKLQAAISWVGSVQSSNKKAFIPYYNPDVPGGEIQFWEDPKPGNGERNTMKCAAHYIVNGGKKSPVIEFNPSFKWDFSMLTSGGGNISQSSIDPPDNESKSKGRRECPTLSRACNPGAGHTLNIPEGENEINEDNERAQDEKQKKNDKQFRALRPANNIEADLVVIGDPSIKPLIFWQRPISITFINPYHLKGPESSCGEWMVEPACNPVLSNRFWLVQSITHKIEAGKYTTTLRVYLTTPGVDIDTGENLGGDQEGWSPPPGCPCESV